MEYEKPDVTVRVYRAWILKVGGTPECLPCFNPINADAECMDLNEQAEQFELGYRYVVTQSWREATQYYTLHNLTNNIDYEAKVIRRS